MSDGYISRSLLHFYYDAYVILTTYKSLQDWTLTLYNQDVRLMRGIKPVKVFNLLSGTELSEQKVQANIIQGLQEKLEKTVNEIGEIRRELLTTMPTVGASTMPTAVTQAVKAPVAVSTLAAPIVTVPAPAPTPKAEVQAPKIAPVAEIKKAVAEKPAEVKPAGKPEILQPPVAAAVTKIPPKEKEELRVPEKPVQEKPAAVKKPSAEEKWAVPPTGDIIIGGTFDMSRNAKNLSTNYIDGLELAFGEANETGGIKGRNIVLKVKDDGSNIHKAYENVQELRNVYKTDLITGPMGASTMAGLIDLIQKGEILSVFPFLASDIVRRPSFNYVINYMVDSFQIYLQMFKYVFEKMGARKPVIIYTNDFPDTLIDLLMKGIKLEVNVKDYAKEPISGENVQFTKEVEDIIKLNPDLIVFLTYPTSAVSFLNQLANKMPDKIIDKIVIIDSSLVGETFSNFIRQKVTRFVMASSVPDPNKVELTVPVQNEKTPLKLYIIENYKKAAQKKDVSVNSIGLIGYISGKLLVEILRHVDGVITKEKVIAAAASMKDVDIEGLPLSFRSLTSSIGKICISRCKY